jgi:hypothetical protein
VDSDAPSLCDACLHLDRPRERTKDILELSTCEAFTRGIPVEIRYGGADHRTPIRGDGGITFTLKSGEEDVLATYERYKAEFG